MKLNVAWLASGMFGIHILANTKIRNQWNTLMSCNWLDGAFTFLLVWDANIFSRQMQIEDFAKKKWVLNPKYNRQMEQWKNYSLWLQVSLPPNTGKTNKTQNSNMVNPAQKVFQIKKMNEWRFDPLHFKTILSLMVNFLK